jgi:hypothetical protein
MEDLKAAELAFEVLKVLDKQKDYFRNRDKETLIESKAMEKALREKCVRVIAQAERFV